MYQRHCISMKAIMLSFVRRNKVTFIYAFSCYMKVFPPARLFLYINLESWPVVGFCPHVGNTGVFGIHLNTLYPILGSIKEVFSTANQAIKL